MGNSSSFFQNFNPTPEESATLLNDAQAAATSAQSSAAAASAAASLTVINWLNSLPTSLPSASGIAWNNGGVLSIS